MIKIRSHRFETILEALVPTLATTIALLTFLAFSILATSAKAQTNGIAADKKQRLAEVLVVINSLLLDQAERSIDLGLTDFDATPRTVADTFDVSLDTQNQDVEFCFYLTASKALQASDITFAINGVAQTGNNALVEGENCYTIPVSSQQAINQVELTVDNGLILILKDIGLESTNQTRLGLPILTRSSWDDAAVRKVLRIFAFGGHARDAQITEWANMRPNLAIAEMLNFEEHNLKLSPLSPGEQYPQTATQYGEFSDFVENFLSNPASNLPISVESREKFEPDGYAFDDTFSYMVTLRGLNPFRQMVGFWETNYHLAVNLDTRVDNRDMMAFYDTIMNAHASGVPYQRVLAAAAKSTAPTAQYGTDNNEYIGGTCFCNEDEAREIHQLYFGIFGEGDEEHHENVTIPNTAAMLSGMKIVDRVPDPERPGRFRYERRYEPRLELDKHHVPPLNILRQTVTGATPLEKIDSLVEFSIEHPDSLFNLPIMIIEGIADDNLNEERKNQLRAAWASMGNNKQFLEFIRAYAISALFHGPQQRKYLSSFWRIYNITNKVNQYNLESLQAGRDAGRFGRPLNSILDNDGVQEFRPTYNVFGGQTSLDAADSAKIFEDNYNRSAGDRYRWDKVECSDCDQGNPWTKDWTNIIPSQNGAYSVDYVAEWLWRHMYGNLKNYTAVERAHLASILGAVNNGSPEHHFDLAMFLCIYNDRVEQGETNNSVSEMIRRYNRNCRQSNGVYSDNELRWLDRGYTAREITNTLESPYTGPYNPAVSNGAIPSIVDQLSVIEMPLTSDDARLRRNANRRIHYALAFLAATPFALVEAGEQ